MKQRIKSCNTTEPVSDLEMVFLAIRNVFYEKHLQEPNKGIIAAKGTEHQRKMTWKELLKLVDALEDFFIFRKMKVGRGFCEQCRYWESISEASPHMGQCNKKKKKPVHAWSYCKNYTEEGK